MDHGPGEAIAQKLKCPFVQVSAKSGENVEKIWKTIFNDLKTKTTLTEWTAPSKKMLIKIEKEKTKKAKEKKEEVPVSSASLAPLPIPTNSESSLVLEDLHKQAESLQQPLPEITPHNFDHVSVLYKQKVEGQQKLLAQVLQLLKNGEGEESRSEEKSGSKLVSIVKNFFSPRASRTIESDELEQMAEMKEEEPLEVKEPSSKKLRRRTANAMNRESAGLPKEKEKSFTLRGVKSEEEEKVEKAEKEKSERVLKKEENVKNLRDETLELYDNLLSGVLGMVKKEDARFSAGIEGPEREETLSKRYVEVEEYIFQQMQSSVLQQRMQLLQIAREKEKVKEKELAKKEVVILVPKTSKVPLLQQQEEETEEPSEEKKAKMIRDRAFVLEELIKTEVDFFRDLETLESAYVRPMEALVLQSNNAKLKLVHSYCLSIGTLKPVSSHLLEALREASNKSSDVQDVGFMFNKHGHYLKMYQQHCTNHSAIEITVAELLEKDREFKLFHEIARTNPECKKLDISSFLIKPLQRICKVSFPFFPY